jgi:hypothetical protein
MRGQLPFDESDSITVSEFIFIQICAILMGYWALWVALAPPSLEDEDQYRGRSDCAWSWSHECMA